MVIATGLGSMPGTDLAEATQVVLGEVGDLPFLVELPARGVTSAMTGRTLALVSDMGFDLQPAGWRLTGSSGSSGIDHRRAGADLTRDLDLVEELAGGHLDAVKLQIAGPWTLAATVERPQGDRVLADVGARRELAEALAEGVRRHVDDIRHRLSPGRVVVQVDEPALPAVLAGEVPTASGFHRHRSITAERAAEALRLVADAAIQSGAETVAHCCAPDVPWDVLWRAGFTAVSFDLGLVARADYDRLGEWADQGSALWIGVVPSADPAGTERLTATAVTNRLLGWYRDLGFDDLEHLPPAVVTPACGLATASPGWARQALALCRETARNLSAESGMMDP